MLYIVHVFWNRSQKWPFDASHIEWRKMSLVKCGSRDASWSTPKIKRLSQELSFFVCYLGLFIFFPFFFFWTLFFLHILKTDLYTCITWDQQTLRWDFVNNSLKKLLNICKLNEITDWIFRFKNSVIFNGQYFSSDRATLLSCRSFTAMFNKHFAGNRFKPIYNNRSLTTDRI